MHVCIVVSLNRWQLFLALITGTWPTWITSPARQLRFVTLRTTTTCAQYPTLTFSPRHNVWHKTPGAVTDGDICTTGMFDVRAVYRRVLSQLKVPSVDGVRPNPLGAKESNPALENVAVSHGTPSRSLPRPRPHLSHIKITTSEYAMNPAYGGNPGWTGPAFGNLRLRARQTTFNTALLASPCAPTWPKHRVGDRHT